jgi:hypothetical protein
MSNRNLASLKLDPEQKALLFIPISLQQSSSSAVSAIQQSMPEAHPTTSNIHQPTTQTKLKGEGRKRFFLLTRTSL